MTRPIIFLALAQIAAVICGFCGLAIILKHLGYPGQPYYFGSNFGIPHWSLPALGLRRFGLILLLLPLVWGSLATLAERRSKYILTAEAWLLVGTLCPLMMVLAFFYAIFHPTVPH